MAAPKTKRFRLAVVGSDTLRGKEIKSVLGVHKFPVQSLEFFDPDVEEEYSKLTQFREEPKVVHHLSPAALEGLDLVFLASDAGISFEYGRLASSRKYRAIDLSETFNADDQVPLVVAGVNDEALGKKKPALVANPNPVTIILCHLFQTVRDSFGIAKALSFVLEPVSAFEEEGIQELADQSFALLSSSSMTKKVFKAQVAFNLLSQTEKPEANGFSARENRVLAEIRRVLGPAKFPLTLSVVLAPVFHTYSIMTYVETEEDARVADMESCFRKNPFFRLSATEGGGFISSVTVAGKDKIFVGPIKKEKTIRGGFWIWTVADNLTFGSAVNAYEIARRMLSVA